MGGVPDRERVRFCSADSPSSELRLIQEKSPLSEEHLLNRRSQFVLEKTGDPVSRFNVTLSDPVHHTSRSVRSGPVRCGAVRSARHAELRPQLNAVTRLQRSGSCRNVFGPLIPAHSGGTSRRPLQNPGLSGRSHAVGGTDPRPERSSWAGL